MRDMTEKILMKGNEAIAISAIRNGVDGYFGYPITPQSEVMETLMKEKPWETTGMVVLQAESMCRSPVTKRWTVQGRPCFPGWSTCIPMQP